MYIVRARSESQSAVKSSGLNAHSSSWRAVELKYLLDNNNHVHRQSQVRKLSRFVSGHSVCWRFDAWDLGFESCIQQWKTTCLLSIRISLACARASKSTTTNMYVCIYVCLWLCFWHNFSGMKRTCWTTGSWRSCLSLEVVSSIPPGPW